MTDVIGQVEYISPASTGDDLGLGMKERIKYFEELKRSDLSAPPSPSKPARRVSINTAKNQIIGESPSISPDVQPLESDSNNLESEFGPVDDIASAEIESLGSFDMDEFDRRISIKINENEFEKEENDSESLDVQSVDIQCPEITEDKPKHDDAGKNSSKPIDEPPSEMDVPISNSRRAMAELKERLKGFKEESQASRTCFVQLDSHDKPSLFSCSELKKVTAIPNINMIESLTESPLFSRKQREAAQVFFRAPGILLPERPKHSPANSIITEEGVCFYVRITCGATSWYVLKPGNMINNIDKMSDKEFARFILTDIVTTVYRRTPFVFFDGQIVLARILGKVICLCHNSRCLKIFSRDKAVQEGDRGIVSGGVLIKLSCERERDEWMNVISEFKEDYLNKYC